MLLDPCVAEDVKLLSFLGNRVVPATDDELGKERVRVSASIYNLTDAYISSERGKILGEHRTITPTKMPTEDKILWV